MQCKFATNGLAIDYFGTLKPCCTFRADQGYRKQNSVINVDLRDWHKKNPIKNISDTLARNQWPQECMVCQYVESQNRGDSMRLNSVSAYDHYGPNDLILEIRAGSTCNLACQTCWPQASSRVAQYYKQSARDFVPSQDMDWNFDILLSVKERLRDIIILGGEPFYDKRCIKLFKWLADNDLTANVTVFTNGSVINMDFLQNYQGKVILVFSIDAIGKPSEYIRFGSDWSVIANNYARCRDQRRGEIRINITTSPYNWYYLPDLMSWITQDWPDLVTFGIASTTPIVNFMNESIVPISGRQTLLDRLDIAMDLIKSAKADDMQKINAENALMAIYNNLIKVPYDIKQHIIMQSFVRDMDKVKKISIWDYCPEVAEYLDINSDKLA